MSKADENYAFGLYPDGSGGLRNRFGLRDAGALQAVEYQVTTDRERDVPVFPLTRDGYQALHRHLFQEVFDWAGELRTVNFGKGGSRFATARYLDATLDTLFTELASRDNRPGPPPGGVTGHKGVDPRAGASAPPAERALAILAAAGRLPDGVQQPGAAAG